MKKYMSFMSQFIKIRVNAKLVGNGFAGFSILNYIFVSEEKYLKYKTLINHEKIHYYQQVELFFIPMWILYGLSFLTNIFIILLGLDTNFVKKSSIGKKYGFFMKAYRNNIFEIEAYENETDTNYLENRKFLSWVKYLNNYGSLKNKKR